MAQVPEIRGSCDRRFVPVREAFAANFAGHGELGAAVVVAIGGRPVVDIWAGWMDEARTRPWGRDTLVDVFSAGKPMAAACVLLLAERGEVELDERVARYWPEFAAAGKDGITVRMLLSHRAGLPAIRRRLADQAIYDWDHMTAALAAEEPWWTPGTTHGYHVNTLGFLAGEVVRRVTGESLGAFFRREVGAPLEVDFHFGFGPEHDSRVAEYVFSGDGGNESDPADGDDRRFLLGRVYLNPPGLSGLGTVNTRAWRSAQIPSANGHATARAVARMYSSFGERFLGRETIAQATAEHSAGTDFVLGRPSRFGLGFQLTQPERQLGPSPRSFGHFGVGGSLGFADPDADVAFGYVMNRFGARWQNPRNRALIDAVYASLE